MLSNPGAKQETKKDLGREKQPSIPVRRRGTRVLKIKLA